MAGPVRDGVSRLRRWAAAPALAACALAASPPPATACAVCFSAKEGTLTAYYGTTVGLTLLPLLMAGAAAFWFRRKLREAEQRRTAPLSPEGPDAPHRVADV